MAKKSGNFFEQNIDKIVLGLMGLICLAILFLMVVRSPNTIQIDGRSYGPGEIDSVISRNAGELEVRLAAPAQPRSYVSRFSEFRSMYASAVSVSPHSVLPLPAPIPERSKYFVGAYREPRIPNLGRLVAGVVSGVASVPLGTSPVGADMEPQDVDLVTLESTFDVAALFRQMRESFPGETELQRPVFAAIELQRQEMNEDGTWPSDEWQTVQPIRVSPYGDILNVETIKATPIAEAEALRAQLQAGLVAINVLQPAPYDFLSRAAPWLPPVLEERRRQAEARQAMVAGMPGGETAVSPRESGRPTRTAPARPGMTEMEGEGGRPTRTSPAITPRQPTTPARPGMPPGFPEAGPQTPEQEFDAIRIVSIDFLETRQAVTVWAHDDSTTPGKTYRYRMRLGILNPIAGRGRSTSDPALENELIFWSDFTGDAAAREPHPVAYIPARMYIFPTRHRESDNMVTVEVAKYNMARWERRQYEVKPGDMIGRVERMPPATDISGNMIPVPDVDFSTGITLLDVQMVTEFRPTSPNPVVYPLMLYRDADNNIRSMLVQSRGASWSRAVRTRYNAITDAMRLQPLVPEIYTGTVSGPSHITPDMPSMPTSPGMFGEE
ncbi:MAG TPA: hypothetical protein VLH60_07000 [Sedimentisphaerales bacterium]|nr:hypothetical protein [Sedimentisphaerales bacterium]